MTVKKYYYPLQEISNLLDVSIDDLMHYGITGQLGMCFDWALIRDNISINNLPFKLTLEFKDVPPKWWKPNVDKLLNSDHVNDPIERLFPLSIELLSVIYKQGFIKLINAYDDSCGLTLEIIKTEDGKHVEYPSITLNDIVVVSGCYEQFAKKFQLDLPDENAFVDAESIFEHEEPNKLYFARSLNREVWPIPDNMNLPSKSELGELLLSKDPGLCKADIEAMIRLSTPDGIVLGGKQKKNKIPFVPVHLR